MSIDSAASRTLVTLVMTRRFKAKRELVFAAVSEAHHLKQWMCPAGFTVTDVVTEPRVGGCFRLQMRSPEGQPFVTNGEYLSIDPPRRLVFTWTWEPGHTMPDIETVVTIELMEKNGETLLTMTHAGFSSQDERDSHERGWGGAYDRLGSVLPKMAGE